PMLIIAGLLVGFGTRYGSGCTSGHGVCGLSYLSLRSLVATLSFMAMGFLTVYVIKHLVA
ncbi:MAG TPA: YeeE/YedE thiosulfate transporter family protein, partial [Agitococcus sp.]|nr:YeeE/YedE thiosulfate transporter family protein [Agitococcus sp.]